MSNWCGHCKREPYIGCDSQCPVFARDPEQADILLADAPKPMIAQLFARPPGKDNEFIVCGLVKTKMLSPESVHVLKTSALEVIQTTDIEQIAYGKTFDQIMQEAIWRHFK